MVTNASDFVRGSFIPWITNIFPPKESNKKLRGIERLKLNTLSRTVKAPGS
jgi:hypothetical protein